VNPKRLEIALLHNSTYSIGIKH